MNILQESKTELKGLICFKMEDEIKQLSFACLSILYDFFEKVKKQLLKAEMLIKLN